jgi:carboxymethylenebutenolidase
MASLDNGKVVAALRPVLEALEGAPEALKGPAGVIGWCMSGQYAASAAGHFPARVRACVTVHGIGLKTQAADSPHLLAPRFEAAFYLAFASDDPLVPEETVAGFAAALKAQGVPHEVEIHPQTEHAFFFPSRPVYRETAAEKVWQKTLALFGARLKTG